MLSKQAYQFSDLLIEASEASLTRAAEVLSALPGLDAAKLIIEAVCSFERTIEDHDLGVLGDHIGAFPEVPDDQLCDFCLTECPPGDFETCGYCHKPACRECRDVVVVDDNKTICRACMGE